MKTLSCMLLYLLTALPAQAATITLAAGDDAVAAFAASSAGDTIIFTSGTYRRNNMTPKDNQTIILNSRVKLTGADILSSWTQDGDRWYASGQTQGTAVLTGQCDTGYRCNKAEDLFVDDQPWDHMTSLAAVTKEGQWFFDYDTDRIYVFGDPTGKLVETSISGHAFSGTADNVTLHCRGGTIEKYATPAQRGAIGGAADATPGDGWKVIGCHVRHIHGIAIKAGTNWEVRDSTLCDNGQMGAGGSGTGATWVNNTVCRNNYARFSAGWEAGGMKFTSTTNHRFLRNKVFDNRGPGVWYDIDNFLALIEGNDIYNNTHEGIKYEISDTATIRHNRVAHNGVVFHEWLLVPQIHLQNCEGCLVERNAMTVPQGTTASATDGPHGVMITCQDRGNPGWTCLNNIVQDNVIVMTGNRGMNGAGEDITGEVTGFYTTNLFRRNTYQVLDLATDHWHWNGAAMNFTEWIAATGEVGATVHVIHSLD